MAAVSGKAGEIRAATESEQFDLAGTSAAQVEQLVEDAFGAPMEGLQTMIRISLVVGAGKLGRQKYPADLPKALVQALQRFGYREDTGAALLWECAGTFKHQHDTGKNLKIVHVYPHATPPADEADEDAGPQWTPQQQLCVCTLEEFEAAVANRTPTWKTRRQLVQVLQGEAAGIGALEQRLCQGEVLEPDEQTFYDAVSTELLEAKAAHLQAALRTMVEEGRIDARDKAAAVEAAKERLGELQAVENPGSKIAKQIDTVTRRIAHLESMTPVEIPLQHAERITAMWNRLGELEYLQKKEHAGNLTLLEIRELAERDELREEVEAVQNASRGWFEEEEDFEARKAQGRERWVAGRRSKRQAANKRARAKKASGWAPTSVNRGAVRAPAQAKKAGAGVRSKFAALGLDSDSDSD